VGFEPRWGGEHFSSQPLELHPMDKHSSLLMTRSSIFILVENLKNFTFGNSSHCYFMQTSMENMKRLPMIRSVCHPNLNENGD
jgi:hypothetical protein